MRRRETASRKWRKTQPHRREKLFLLLILNCRRMRGGIITLQRQVPYSGSIVVIPVATDL